MKHFFSIVAALSLAAVMSAAQTTPTPANPTGNTTQGVQQYPPPGTITPPAQKTPAQPPAAQAPTAQAPAGKKRPEAKTQAEFQDFQTAQASATPDALEKAADTFAQKYPNSELRTLLYSRAMMMYQSQNNADKL